MLLMGSLLAVLSAATFALNGVTVRRGVLTGSVAQAIAPITVVAPIQRSASLFKVTFNWFVNRQYEIFEARLLAGILISVLGGVALSLSTDFVVAHVPLPDFMLGMIGWTWAVTRGPHGLLQGSRRGAGIMLRRARRHVIVPVI